MRTKKKRSAKDREAKSKLLMAVADTARRVSYHPGVWYPLFALTRAHVRLLMRHERVNNHFLSVGDIAESVREGTAGLRNLAVEMYRKGDEDAGSNFRAFATHQDEVEKAYSEWVCNLSGSAQRAGIDIQEFAKTVGVVKPVKGRDYTHWKAGLDFMLEQWNLHREGSLYPDDGPNSEDNGSGTDKLLDEAWRQDCAHAVMHRRLSNGHIGEVYVPRNPVEWDFTRKRYVPTNERTTWVRVNEGKRRKLVFYRKTKGAIREFSIVEGQGIDINTRMAMESRRAKHARTPEPYTVTTEYRETKRMPLAPKMEVDYWPRRESMDVRLYTQGLLRGPITCTRGDDEWTWQFSKEHGCYVREKKDGTLVELPKDLEKKVLRMLVHTIERRILGLDDYEPCNAEVWREEVQPGKLRIKGKRQRRWMGTYKGFPVTHTHCNICNLVSECVTDSQDWRHLQQEHSRNRFPIKGRTGNLVCLRCGAAVMESSIMFRAKGILGRGKDNVVWSANVDVFGSRFMRFLRSHWANLNKAWGKWYWTPREDQKPEVELGVESQELKVENSFTKPWPKPKAEWDLNYCRFPKLES